jgi:Ca2+-binding EF-hand superfamily protein
MSLFLEFVNIWIDRQAAKRKQELLSLKLSVRKLEDLDADGDGKVSRLEFFHFMLDQLGKVSKEEINEINAKFEELDRDGSGFLDQEDLDKLK